MNQGYPPTNVVIAPAVSFGESPMQTTCANCHQTIVTTTVAENGACAYIAALVVCLVFCPLFWIPLCVDSCKDVYHKCPSCGAQLGVFKKI